MEDAEQELSFNRFFEIYKQKILPQLRGLQDKAHWYSKEYKRLEDYNKYLLGLLVISICSPLILCWLMMSNIYTPLLNAAIIIFFIFGCIVSIVFLVTNSGTKNKINKEYKTFLKQKTINNLLEVFGDIKWIKHNKTITWDYYDENHDLDPKSPEELIEIMDKFEKETYGLDKFDRSGLFLNFNERYLDDEFKCVHKGVPFNIYEIMLFYRGSDSKHSYQVFEGIVINFKYNKKIKNRTVVATKGNATKKQNFMYSLLITAIASLEVFKHGYSHGKLILAIIMFLICAFLEWRMTKNDEPLKDIHLEDPKFNKKFNVYSSDEVEARYLVTPLFMELLSNLKTAFNSEELKCSFFDDNFMIAISTNEDVFEIGDINIPYNNPKFIMQFWRELSSIYKMVEYFRLNKELYPKNSDIRYNS